MRSNIYLLVLLILLTTTLSFGKIIYVDDDANGANDGSSWENAYIYLQDALANADSSEKPLEILVAQGTYKPDQGANQTIGNQMATFQLINGVTLKGGYAGIDANDPNACDIELYETILSGDLNCDDVEVANPRDLLHESTRAENSKHVVTGSGTDETAVLYGFTISSGNALEYPHFHPDNVGGGMYNYQGSPTLNNCTFSGNSTVRNGGGIYNYESSSIMTNCIFSNNSAEDGGGMHNYESYLTIIDCIFNDNWAEHGGGIYNDSGSLTLTNCIIIGNTANDTGGGILCHYTSFPTITGCIISKNSAQNQGGGMFCKSLSNSKLTNCIFSGNSAEQAGGGIYSSGSNPTLINCIFSGNSANLGGGIYNWESNSALTNCTLASNSALNGNALYCDTLDQNSPSAFQIKNCILWDGGNEIYNPDGSQITIDYTNLQGGLDSIEDPCNAIIWGIGNIDIDPCFADPGYWVDVYDPNVIVEPNDPNAFWIDGDYHLKSQAGRWDPNSETWVLDEVTSLCIDAGDPNSPVGEEPIPNGGIINMGAYGGTAEASKSNIVIYIQWLGHSSVKVWSDDVTVYVDPQNLDESLHDANIVCVTHTHGDHYSPADIAKVSNSDTQFIGPADVVQQYGSGQIILPEQTVDFNDVIITAVAAYNINKTNHPKSNNWVGFIITLGGKRIYVAGDTDLTDEMKALEDIDVAFLPAGGTYTMNATEAAEATQYIRPRLAIPYHWGQIVGNINDAQTFADLAQCAVVILEVGETISSEDWPEYSPLIAHWKLDETDGDIAFDSARDNDGILEGGPLWQPDGGIVDGALEFDGINDYVSTPYVLNPGTGQFSVFAWIKGESGQVILSQVDGANWLSANTSDGALMTELKGGGRTGSILVSQTVITDDDWHRIGLTWDKVNRILYVDDAIVAQDTQANLLGSEGGMYIGTGNGLDSDTYFYGLIDDVQIYNQVITP